MDNLFVSSLVPALIGGIIVAIVSALLARRQSQSEIETAQLLEAYNLLQEAVAFVVDEESEVSYDDLDNAQKLEMAEKTNGAVVILDLLGSKRILRAIRSAPKSSDPLLRTLDITLVQGELREHIRRKLGLEVSGIPRVLAIPTSAAALQRIYGQAEVRGSRRGSQAGSYPDEPHNKSSDEGEPTSP
jgi:hypothetical protein